MLLKEMLLEEQRMHTNLIGRALFFLFPVLIVIIVMISSLYAPVMDIMGGGTVPGMVFHLLFVFFGLNVGAFGLYGKEFMNRRFGQASLISYSSRTLPVSERAIFSTVIAKDLIYYFALFILPAVIGVNIASLFQGVPQRFMLYLMLSLSLSFMLGISFIFFLSTLYAHSAKLLFVGLAGVIALAFWGVSAGVMFPPYSFFLAPSWGMFLLSFLLAAVPFSVSIIWFKVDYPEPVKRLPNEINAPVPWKNNIFMVKEFIDLQRSQGGVGRIVFSLALPMAMIGVFLHFFIDFIPIANFLLWFSIFLGVYSSSIYSWLSEYDSFANYLYLPVSVSDVIKAKIKSTSLLSIVSLLIFVIAAFTEGSLVVMLIAFVSCASLYWYGLGVTIYLTGLSPNIYFFNARNLFRYLVYIVPPSITMLVVSFLRPLWLLFSPVLILAGIAMLRLSLAKWENVEQPTF